MIRLRAFKFLLFIAFLCLLTSCTIADHSINKPAPSLLFDYLNPLVANGGATRITQTFTPDKMTDLVTKEFGESPAHLIQRYAMSRFDTNMAVYPPRLVFNIKEASLNKYRSETDPLLFMAGMSVDKYKVKIFLELFPVSKSGETTDPYTVYYEKELVLSSNVSLADREYAQFEFYEKMINDIDKAVSDIVLNKL